MVTLAALGAAVTLMAVRLVDRDHRRGPLGRGRGDTGTSTVGPAQAGASAADRPGTRALASEHALGDGDLLGAAGEVRSRSESASAVADPGLAGELQPTGEAVAGVDGPVAA